MKHHFTFALYGISLLAFLSAPACADTAAVAVAGDPLGPQPQAQTVASFTCNATTQCTFTCYMPAISKTFTTWAVTVYRYPNSDHLWLSFGTAQHLLGDDTYCDFSSLTRAVGVPYTPAPQSIVTNFNSGQVQITPTPQAQPLNNNFHPNQPSFSVTPPGR